MEIFRNIELRIRNSVAYFSIYNMGIVITSIIVLLFKDTLNIPIFNCKALCITLIVTAIGVLSCIKYINSTKGKEEILESSPIRVLVISYLWLIWMFSSTIALIINISAFVNIPM